MTEHTRRSRFASEHDGVTSHPDDDVLHNPEVAHEHTDINVRAIIWSGVALVVVCVVTAVLMYGTFTIFESLAARNDPSVSPLAAPPTAMPVTTTESPSFGTAPNPKLLTNEPAALEKLRSSEAERLKGYGWVDQGAGVAHLPIEEAKKLLLERGLAVRPDAIDPATFFAPAQGEASGGRTIGAPKPAPGDTTKAPPAQAPAPKPHGH
jgi:hypothetical protein